MMKVGYECSLMKDLKIKYSFAYKLKVTATGWRI